MNLMILFWLIFAHCMADMVFQSNFISKNKGKKVFCMISHLIIWTGWITIVLQYFEMWALWKFVFLFLGHWITDFWKSNSPKDEAHFYYIYIDQGIHFIQLAIVWWF